MIFRGTASVALDAESASGRGPRARAGEIPEGLPAFRCPFKLIAAAVLFRPEISAAN